MTIEQAIAALHAAGLADAHFNCSRIWFTAQGKGYCLNTDYRASVKAADVAWAIAHAAKNLEVSA